MAFRLPPPKPPKGLRKRLPRRRFPFWQPKGKSSATKTAKVLRAWAADLQRAVDGLRAAASEYEDGNIEQGRWYAHATFAAGVRMIYRFYHQKHGEIDRAKQKEEAGFK